MKKLIALLLITCTIAGCSLTQVAYRTDNYNLLRIGMTKWEVEERIGPPAGYLDARRSPYGYEEILLYRNRYNEPFALEFVNDYLMAADYVYEGGCYPMYPGYHRPAHGNPVFPPGYRPNRRYYPPAEPRPDNRLPSYNYERPSSSSTRPPANERPSSNRPASPGNGENQTRSGSPDSSRNTENTRREGRSNPPSERSSGQNTGTTTRGDNPRNR
jgi:hypothetical protein